MGTENVVPGLESLDQKMGESRTQEVIAKQISDKVLDTFGITVKAGRDKPGDSCPPHDIVINKGITKCTKCRMVF